MLRHSRPVIGRSAIRFIPICLLTYQTAMVGFMSIRGTVSQLLALLLVRLSGAGWLAQHQARPLGWSLSCWEVSSSAHISSTDRRQSASLPLSQCTMHAE